MLKYLNLIYIESKKNKITNNSRKYKILMTLKKYHFKKLSFVKRFTYEEIKIKILVTNPIPYKTHIIRNPQSV